MRVGLLMFLLASTLLLCRCDSSFDAADMDIRDSGVESDEDLEFHHSSHYRVLNDRTRNVKFQRAIEATVRGKTVVNVGSGLALLAMMSAKAGAAHVWAIERHPQVAQMSREIVAVNGLQDVITIIRAKSQDVYVDRSCAPGTPCIPVKADVLLCDVLGAEIFRDGFPHILQDARRLVRSDAQVIPRSARVLAWPSWSTYGLPASGLIHGFDMEPVRVLKSVSHHAQDVSCEQHVKMTEEPYQVLQFDFRPGVEIPYGGRDFRVQVNGSGVVTSVMLYWEAELAPGITLSTGPVQEGAELPATFWNQMWYHQVHDLQVTKDFPLRLSVVHDALRFFPHVYRQGDTRAFLSFFNKCEFDVQIYWSREDGEEHRSGVLISGAELVQQTFVGDKWFLRWNNGVMVTEFSTEPGQARVVIERNHTASIIRASIE